MQSAQHAQVLVVDDDADTVESTVTLLELHGFRATGALGGREAVEAAAVDPPDVALVDLAMPGVDGCETARRLRSSGKQPVVIAVTGLASDGAREQAHEAGFALHLLKPVPPEELVTLVRKCMQLRGNSPR
jgi:CheY-like chemotaxis protein